MLGVWARLADFDFGNQIITRGFHLNGSFSLVCKRRFGAVGWVWGPWASRVGWCGAVLRVWARLGDFDLGVKLTLCFHLNGHGAGCAIGNHMTVFFGGSMPGREARIPRAVSPGEAALLVGYGRCGCPGPGVGCAERVAGVPGVYEYSR